MMIVQLKHENLSLQFTTARITANKDNALFVEFIIRFPIGTLLQGRTGAIRISDSCYDSRQLLLQHSTGSTGYAFITIHRKKPMPTAAFTFDSHMSCLAYQYLNLWLVRNNSGLW